MTRLAWYEGDVKLNRGFKTLAPRGWKCSAVEAANGSWSIVATSASTPERAVSMNAEYNGPGASVACNYFPSAFSASPVPSLCKAPARTTISLISPHLVRFATAPGKPATLPTRGFLYWYPALQNRAEAATCVLPQRQRALCEAILAETRGRIGSELIAALNTGPSPTTTIAAPTVTTTRKQLTATVNGPNGTCLAHVKTGSLLATVPAVSDTFDLRRPGNGATEGTVVAVAASAHRGPNGCSLLLTFPTAFSARFFDVIDETASRSWGPFDAHTLPSSGWALNLIYTGNG